MLRRRSAGINLLVDVAGTWLLKYAEVAAGPLCLAYPTAMLDHVQVERVYLCRGHHHLKQLMGPFGVHPRADQPQPPGYTQYMGVNRQGRHSQ